MRDIAGQTFGRLTALEPTAERNSGHIVWLCRCSCGNTCSASSHRLLNGTKSSCGCAVKGIHTQDLTGQMFARLTAIKAVYQHGRRAWECLCSCGNTVYVSANNLLQGRVRSCGCLLADVNRKHLPKALSKRPLADGTNLAAISRTSPTKANTSGHTGVSWHQPTGKWLAYINFRGKRYHLGVFDDIQDAVEARAKAKDELHNTYLQQKNKKAGEQ